MSPPWLILLSCADIETLENFWVRSDIVFSQILSSEDDAYLDTKVTQGTWIGLKSNFLSFQTFNMVNHRLLRNLPMLASGCVSAFHYAKPCRF